MLTREVVLDIIGHPAPKGSLKCIGRNGHHQLIEDNTRTKEWRAEISTHAKRLLNTPDKRADKHQPIGVEVTFSLERPKGHHRTGARAHQLVDSAPQYPVTRSSYDVDKLLRLVLDALQDAGVLHDDAAVVEVTTRKFYLGGDVPDAYDRMPWPGVRIRLFPMDGHRA